MSKCPYIEGGAVAIGTGNNVLMLENSVYSVISPEGCSSILWKDTSKTAEAAEALKLTASDTKSRCPRRLLCN